MSSLLGRMAVRMTAATRKLPNAGAWTIAVVVGTLLLFASWSGR